MERKDIKSMTLQELECDIAEMGLPKFRAAQIYRQLFGRLAVSFEEMSDISAAMAAQLSERYYITAPEVVSKLVSKIDGTIGFLEA